MTAHTPMIVPALVDTACKAEACDHDACPTAGATLCQTCSESEPLIGMVAFGVRWPCRYARGGQR